MCFVVFTFGKQVMHKINYYNTMVCYDQNNDCNIYIVYKNDNNFLLFPSSRTNLKINNQDCSINKNKFVAIILLHTVIQNRSSFCHVE